MTTFTVTSVNSLRCHVSTCLRIGSKLRYIRSTPTEMQSISESDFEESFGTGLQQLMVQDFLVLQGERRQLMG